MKASLAWITQISSKDHQADYAMAVATDPFGFVYIAGYTYGTIEEHDTQEDRSPDAWLAKFDRNGNRLWVAQIASYDKENEEALGVATDRWGNVYVAGYTEGTLGEASSTLKSVDAWVAKFSSQGKQIWIKQVGSKEGAIDKATGLATDASGNVYLTGYTDGVLASGGTGQESGQDAWIAKFSSKGEQIWLKQITSEGVYGDIAQAVATDAFGNVFISGYTEGDMGEREEGDSSRDIWLAKFDSEGDQLWISQIGSVDNKQEEAYAIATDSHGSVYMAGYTAGLLGDRKPDDESVDAFLAKFDKNGKEVWLKQIGSEDKKWDEALGVAIDPFGDVYVAGFTYGSMGDQRLKHDAGAEAWMAKYAQDGVQLWIKQIQSDAAHWGEARAIACDSFGNIFLTGFTDDQYGSGSRQQDDQSLDAWLAKFYQEPETLTELSQYVSGTLGHITEAQYRLTEDLKALIIEQFDKLRGA